MISAARENWTALPGRQGVLFFLQAIKALKYLNGTSSLFFKFLPPRQVMSEEISESRFSAYNLNRKQSAGRMQRSCGERYPLSWFISPTPIPFPPPPLPCHPAFLGIDFADRRCRIPNASPHLTSLNVMSLIRIPPRFCLVSNERFFNAEAKSQYV